MRAGLSGVVVALALALAACGPEDDAPDAGVWPDADLRGTSCGYDGDACCVSIQCNGPTAYDNCDVAWICHEGVKLATPTGCTCEVQ